MNNTDISKVLNSMNRDNREKLLKYLINLEKQDNSYNQEPASSFPQKVD